MPAELILFAFFAFIFAAAFVAVFLAARITALVGEPNVPVAPGTSSSSLLREESVSSISPMAAILERLRLIKQLDEVLDQANIAWSPGRVVAMMLLAGAISLTFFSEMHLPSLMYLILGAGAAWLPLAYILHIRKKRFARFEADFPDAIDSLCRALRAGHPFSAGMEMLTNEISGPVASELRKTIDEWRLGSTWDQALDNLLKRVPMTDVGIFAAAVRLQMRSGGRLGEVLGRLAESMRENTSIRGEVRALAAHGRMTGTVLTLLPIGIAAIMFTVNPSQLLLLVRHPLGDLLIGAAVACLIAAHFIIRKIVDIRL